MADGDGIPRTEEGRWRAICSRSTDAERAFVYAVRTTGVFCRPTCRSRRPLRRNVLFFDSSREATLAGFRPCRRCRPDDPTRETGHRELVLRACRQIEAADEPPSLQCLARDAGLSPFYFQRVFKRLVGVSPKQYALGLRSRRFRGQLKRARSVTAAIYDAGYQSNSRVYDRSSAGLGMRPSVYRKGGVGMTIDFAIAECDLGQLLVAATKRGVCAIALADDAAALRRGLHEEFPHAQCVENRSTIGRFLEDVVSMVQRPSESSPLPLDVFGTAFQLRVWQAVRRIGPGASRSYQEIADEIGAPRSARAVAQACAKNRLALAIPCHRVIRGDGRVSGYRWGKERKQRLLEREQTVTTGRRAVRTRGRDTTPLQASSASSRGA